MTDSNNQTPPSDKMVPEKDLLAVKAGAENKIKEMEATWTAKETEYQKQLSDSKSEVIKASAAVKQLEAQVTLGTSSMAELEGVKKQLADAVKSGTELKTKMQSIRVAQVASYGVPAEKLSDKSLEQLDLIEDALKSAGKKPTDGSFNRMDGGGGSHGGAPLSAIDKCKQELASAVHIGKGEKEEE